MFSTRICFVFVWNGKIILIVDFCQLEAFCKIAMWMWICICSSRSKKHVHTNTHLFVSHKTKTKTKAKTPIQWRESNYWYTDVVITTTQAYNSNEYSVLCFFLSFVQVRITKIQWNVEMGQVVLQQPEVLHNRRRDGIFIPIFINIHLGGFIFAGGPTSMCAEYVYSYIFSIYCNFNRILRMCLPSL